MRSGFSLVELSIVLVILGLLTGGILAGQSLIRAAEIRKITTKQQQYIAAVNSFRDKYFALPGDMGNATKFWGVQTNATACKTTASTTALTCDGNGDGYIGWNDSAHAQFYESFSTWKHLANAGLIEGSYTGVYDNGGTSELVPGKNLPPSVINPGYYMMVGTHEVTIPPYYFTLRDGNIMMYTTRVWPVGVLKAEEMWNIDTKMDDGKPGFGKIETNASTACATTTTASTAEYALTQSTNACEFLYFM